jgi:hypothetical protein
MARTRSKGAAGTSSSKEDKKSAVTTKASPSVYTLPAESDNPPKLFILPKTATPSARIVTLQHPRYNKPTRYLVCPEAGFFEFTNISPPKTTPRSWLVTTADANNHNGTTDPQPHAQITQSPSLYLATPYDPLFLLLPALFNTTAEDQKRMFLSLEDHLDATLDPSKHLSEILSTCPASRKLIEARLAAVCDVVQAGDEDMYRVSEGKVLREVWSKARRMVEGGKLPGSMEERFVRRELEAPVLGVRVVRGNGVVSGGQSEAKDSASGSATPSGEESAESQSSVSSVETAVSSGSEVSNASTAATSVGGEEDVASAMTASEVVVGLQRLRVAFNFICSSYLAPAIAELLKERLAKATDLVDFKPLNEYLERLAKLRQEAAAARTTDYSRKRAADEEEDERAEKRRKKEAEEKARKANMSRGVRNLMKVNTSGMKKMSDFFKKKT